MVALDEDDRYAGIVLPAEVHADADENHQVRDLLHYTDTVLLPQMTIKEAVAMFENAESDALAVVDGARDAARDRAADRAVRAAPLQRGTGPPAAGAVRGVVHASPPPLREGLGERSRRTP